MNPHLELLLSRCYDGALAPAHRADLEKSDISEALRGEQGIRSVSPSLFEPLGHRIGPAVTSMLLFPYMDVMGQWTGHAQCKLFPPPDGRGQRYSQPRGSGSRVYFVRRTLAAVRDPGHELWICEGVKKCLRAAELGLVAIAIQGIHNWHARGTRGLLEDFDQIPLVGRRVRIVPDGDVRVNPKVERGAADLADALLACGASARIVLLPVGAKLDDLVAA